jgi:nitroimidazol reductase NimA-like FMN-containing flavoprotein (pyridoxamine 5'-phosphate oxidase superfamily)
MQELNWADAERVLARNHRGRLACYSPNHDSTYIVPMSYAYHDGSIYFATLSGQKLEYLREHPQGVCFEVDEITNDETWLSVIATGVFVELHGAEHEGEVHAAFARALHGPLRTRFYSTTAHTGLPVEALHVGALRITSLTAREDHWAWDIDFAQTLKTTSPEPATALSE